MGEKRVEWEFAKSEIAGEWLQWVKGIKWFNDSLKE
jgi:hypothetical protein